MNWLSQNFQKHGNKIALVDGISDRKYTYSWLLRMCKNAASGLVRLGVKKHDVIAIFSQNSPEFAVIFFAASATGATVTAVNSSFTTYEVVNQLKDSGAKYLYASQELLNKAKDASSRYGNIRHMIVPEVAPGCVSLLNLMNDDGSAYPSTLTFDPKNDLLTLPYSSGTTGLPKGVMLTHRNFVSNFTIKEHEDTISPAMKELLAKNPDFQLSIMGLLPMYHIYGQIVLVFGLMKGHKVVVLPRFIPEKFLSAIENHRINQLSIVPPLVIFLAKSPLVDKFDLSSIMGVGCGGAPLAKETQDEACRKLGVKSFLQGYGLTETSAGVTDMCYLPGYGIKSGSVGIPRANTELQTVEPGTSRILGPGERGEIWIRGPQVMKGYLKKPEATKATLDDNGWLHTGDIGYHDEQGYFYIVDRIKELIKFKGFQVAPAELEGLLLSHTGIDDVGVYGVKDKEAGELPKALVVKKPGVDVTKEQIHAFVDEHLSHYKRLRGGIEFVKEIPKSPAGKILRRELAILGSKSRI